jgi:hypothetical protein
MALLPLHPPGNRSTFSVPVKTCPFSAEPASPSSSWLYLLERFDVGVVHIDRELRVVGHERLRATQPAGAGEAALRQDRHVRSTRRRRGPS